jgi:hypothetical protein
MRLSIHIGVVCAIFLHLTAYAFSQSSYAKRLPMEIVTLPTYEFGTSATQNALLFKMPFASSRINQAASWREGQKFRQIDLVFTLYPKQPEDWKVGYDSLMERRFRVLEGRMPQVFQDASVQWRLVIQTACNTMAEAQGMFHGFVCYPASDEGLEPGIPLDSVVEEPWTYPTLRFDSTKLRANLDIVQQIIAGERSSSDSTAIQVLDRHPEWKNALVVIDWTASMYRQGAMVIAWQQAHRSESRIRHFVFFNDGDQKYDADKVVGETGGIYQTPADTLPAMQPIIDAVTLGGEGGDHRENNLEAILQGLASCPECEQVILVADNTGPVRDMALLELVQVPVRVLVCGVYKDVLETDYLEIADRTRGSLHTRDRDLSDLRGQLVQGVLTLGDKQYAPRGKHWVKYEPRF